ncbi:MAG: adenine phosphoribosyltransferase [Actinomycetota bacterium]|nr:adenine phosphoribosyltransferase [Actinomycetota bacterium]
MNLASLVRDVPDYPEPGIVFKDLTPLLANAEAFKQAVDDLATGHDGLGGIDKVVGIEARGFLLAAPVAYLLGAGVVPVRKPGKLPGPVHERAYELEYGSNSLEVHQDAFAAGDRVLILDDVLATGGTAAAAVHLVQHCGATVVGVSVLLELAFLHGRATLPGLPVHAVLTVEA